MRPPVPFRSLVLALLAGWLLGAVPLARPVAAADQVTMDARALLQGHARVGSWMQIAVTLANAGEPITGELRLAAGSQGQTRFSTPVDLPTGSRKSYALYVQPPGFGTSLTVELVAGSRSVARREVAFSLHDTGQLVVGVLAERPEPIVTGLRALADSSALPPTIVPLVATDLPDRAEAWSALDRLVWQDVEAASLRPEQLAALAGWVADGGRLTVIGGTGGPATLAGFPDGLLPYRPTAVVDVPPAALAALLGPLPPGATADLPALGGTTASGQVLATVGGSVVAAEAAHGQGAVTLVGFDPDAAWLARTPAADGLWRRIVPTRGLAGGAVLTGDDSMVLNALMALPSLALPPLGGLILLLLGYIVAVGPVSYLVLRRLDRREWAWATIPALILVFTAAAFAMGATVRGGDLVVNQVAVVRGATDSEVGAAQVYVGLFSPVRSTYEVRLPDGALVSSPTSEAAFGGTSLDVVQGSASIVRGLDVGYGSLRALRAETSAPLPRVSADLRLEGGTVSGSVTNASGRPLEDVAVVFGSGAEVLGKLAPGERRDVSFQVDGAAFGDTLSNRVLGQMNFMPGTSDEATRVSTVRHFLLDRLSMDPNFQGPGVATGGLASDQPVLLAWASGPLVDVRVVGQAPRAMGESLYYVPLPLTMGGEVHFGSGLVRSTIVTSDGQVFTKDPTVFNFAAGSMTVAYRPLGVHRPIAATSLVLTMNGSGGSGGQEIAPLGPAPTADTAGGPSAAPSSVPLPAVGIPAVDLFDRSSGTWMTLPPLAAGGSYRIADPARYVDPQTGAVLVRFRNPNQEMVGFQFAVEISGRVG
ncbi:MAG TPA: hypothetical protein VF763_08810 [Candidatus Limnocylindrales bacterium]